MIIKIHNRIKTKNKNILNNNQKEINKIWYKIKFNLHTKNIKKLKKENKFKKRYKNYQYNLMNQPKTNN